MPGVIFDTSVIIAYQPKRFPSSLLMSAASASSAGKNTSASRRAVASTD